MSKYSNNFSLFRRCQNNFNKDIYKDKYSSNLRFALVLISYGMIKLYGSLEEKNIYNFIDSINFIYYPYRKNDFISKVDYHGVLYPTLYFNNPLDFNNFKSLIYKVNYYFYKSRRADSKINLSFRNGFYTFDSKGNDDSFLESLIRLECEDILKNIINLNKNDKVDYRYKKIILNYLNKPYSYYFDGYENEVNLLRNLYYQKEFKKSFIHSNRNDDLLKNIFAKVFGDGAYFDFINLLNDFSYSLKENNYYVSSNIYCSIRSKYILKYMKIKDKEKCLA